jgi:hypothetical protein
MAHSRMVVWDGKGSAPRMSQMATMVFGHKATMEEKICYAQI